MSQAPKTRRPGDGAFKQQRLPAWQPILTPKTVIPAYMCIGIVFIPIGIVLLVSSNQVIEFTKRYDNIEACKLGAGETERVCMVEMDVQKEMKEPVYLYYKLTNYYQNHRRYVKSRSDTQLRGKSGDTADCSPRTKFNDQLLKPCGLIAFSLFNDTFDMYDANMNAVELTKKGIAWESDMDAKFKDSDMTGFVLPPYWPPTVTQIHDEDLAVWMRVAGLPSFKKLHRIIHSTLPKGLYQFNVTNRYDVSGFKGTKSLVLSTTTWIGGKNNFLAILYLVVGFVAFFCGIGFMVKNMMSPRKLGDQKYLVWNRAN